MLQPPSEPSGPVAPAPGQAPDTVGAETYVRVPTKALTYIAGAALAAALGGGGVSYATRPATELDRLAAAVDAQTEAVAALSVKVDTYATNQTRSEEREKAAAADRARLERRVDDLEERLRRVERGGRAR